MKLLTAQQLARLRANGLRQQHRKGTPAELDFQPVVKLFTPDGTATWLLTENRRQQVMPEQPATSDGRSSRRMEVYRTKSTPKSAWRASTGGRPPFERGRAGRINGSISAHRSSGSSFLAMPTRSGHMANQRFC